MLSRQVKSRIKKNQKRRELRLWVSQDARGLELPNNKQLQVLIHNTKKRTANAAVEWLLKSNLDFVSTPTEGMGIKRYLDISSSDITKVA